MSEKAKKMLLKAWLRAKRSVWFQLVLNIAGGVIGNLLYQLFSD